MTIDALYQLDLAPAVQRLLCHPALDLPMKALSMAGEGWFLVLLAVVLSWRGGPDRRTALKAALRGFAALAVTGIVVVVIKRLVGAPRPLQLLGADHVRVLLEPLRLNSFPSGHSAGSAAFAIWAFREPSVKARWPIVFAALVGLSRVYVGAHWVTDVVAGLLLGAALAAAVTRAWPSARPVAPKAPAPAAPGEVES